ncbi:solute carrier family 22 member 1, partial [Trichonephila clavata]
FLPESPRWLVSREKFTEATDVLMRIAKANEKTIDRETLLAKVKILGDRIQKEKETVSNSPMDLIRHPYLRKKFLIVTYCWVANDLAYYGLQYNLPNLDGNPFFTFFVLSIVEFPGLFSIWYLMEKWGRRWSSASFLGLAGLACLVVAVIPDGKHYIATFFYIFTEL